MTPRHIGFAVILILWLIVLAAATIGLQLDFAITLIVGLVGLLLIRQLFREPPSGALNVAKIPPTYEMVAHKLDAIEAEMRRIGFWQNTPLQPEQYDFRAAFAGDTMAFPQWLQFIFIPNVRAIITQQGKFPATSQVGAYAVREFDTYGENVYHLTHLLSEFDQLF